MRILFLTDNFPPEVNAPASRTFAHCKYWVKQGHQVTVITCAPNFPLGKVYEGYRNKLCQKEMIEGIRVIRVWSYIAANEGFVKRVLDYVSFSISSFCVGLFQKCDVIVATSPQFFTALSGRALHFWKRVPWIMEVRDIWPESIKTVGVMKDNAIIRYFEWQERRCYRSAAKVIVVTDTLKDVILHKVKKNKVYVINNGVDKDLFQPMGKDVSLLKELQLEGKCVIGYIGTHGLAHKLDFVLQCAKELDGKSNYHFLFIGAGAEKKNLLRLKEDLKLSNVTMLDSVAKNKVGKYISILDVALINLKKSELFEKAIPSKIFENAVMQIPILLGVDGEARSIIEKYHAGVFFEPENKEDFVQKLNLLNDKVLYQECKEGCKKLAEDFDRNRLAEKMLGVIMEV
ncbi:MAG: glycosyltransferase family 4 protein [Odoribacter splanchnicus]|nr:glycosyltransferase family 4 protein [Odoribacter splanchnicus]